MIPQNKEELIVDIQKSYALLKDELNFVDAEMVYKKAMDGHAKGTVMSICNLVSYLLGWNKLVLKWYNMKSRGLDCDFPETGYKWNELGKLAQKFYQNYAHLEYYVLVTELDHTVHEILDLVGNLDNKSLYEESWYGKWTLGRMIQLNTSSPFRNSRIRLRKHKNR